MMLGGSLMMFFGMLFMLAVIVVPLLVLITAVAGVWGLSARRGGSPNTNPGYNSPVTPKDFIAQICSHCGQSLQTNWTHCPHCGAAIE